MSDTTKKKSRGRPPKSVVAEAPSPVIEQPKIGVVNNETLDSTPIVAEQSPPVLVRQGTPQVIARDEKRGWWHGMYLP